MAFGKVSRSVIENPAISLGAKTVYSLLTCYMSKQRTCYPSVKTIAESLDIGESTVKRYLRELVQHNIIERSPREYKQSYLTTVIK